MRVSGWRLSCSRLRSNKRPPKRYFNAPACSASRADAPTARPACCISTKDGKSAAVRPGHSEACELHDPWGCAMLGSALRRGSVQSRDDCPCPSSPRDGVCRGRQLDARVVHARHETHRAHRRTATRILPGTMSSMGDFQAFSVFCNVYQPKGRGEEPEMKKNKLLLLVGAVTGCRHGRPCSARTRSKRSWSRACARRARRCRAPASSGRAISSCSPWR